MMQVLGYDPGVTLAESAWVVNKGWNHQSIEGFESGMGWHGTLLQPAALVIEVPVSQGQLRKQQPLYDACFAAGMIAGLWQASYGNPPPIYLVPRRVIMEQLGIPSSDNGLLAHFIGLKLLEGKRDKAGNLRCTTKGFTTTHARAALAVSMWNFRDPRNQQYKLEI